MTLGQRPGNKAFLVVAKHDRLARNVAFLSHLMESGVDFIEIDLPWRMLPASAFPA